MAWGRKIECIIGNTDKAFIISDLDIDFNIERSITLSENTAEITIYNAKESTRKDILKIDNTIIFKVGFDDEILSTIFAGNITESQTFQQGPDWITKIKAIARATNKPLENLNISISYAPGTILSKPLQDISNLIGTVIQGIENAQFQLPNGWVYVGGINGALRYIKDILFKQSTSLYIDNNELVVYKIGQPSKFTVVYLTYEGGLLEVQEIMDDQSKKKNGSSNPTKKDGKRLNFKSLIISQIQVNGLVIFNSPSFSGTYIVEKLTFNGNNYGGDFNMEGEVVSR